MSEDEKAIDRWNELLETITEEEAEWIEDYTNHEDGNSIAADFFYLDDYVSRQLVTPTLGACHQMEKLLIKMRKILNADD